MGKPDPVIYKVALEMLQLPKEKVIAIGDSLQHDIQGSPLKTAAFRVHIDCNVVPYTLCGSSSSHQACHDCTVPSVISIQVTWTLFVN